MGQLLSDGGRITQSSPTHSIADYRSSDHGRNDMHSSFLCGKKILVDILFDEKVAIPGAQQSNDSTSHLKVSFSLRKQTISCPSSPLVPLVEGPAHNSWPHWPDAV